LRARRGAEARFFLGAVVALAAVVVAGLGCPEKDRALQHFLKPATVEIKDLFVSWFSGDNLDLTLALEIDNPNPVALTLVGLEYELAVLGQPLAQGVVDARVQIKPAGQSEVQVPVAVALKEALSIYEQSKVVDVVDYELKGHIRLHTWLGDLHLPFQQGGQFHALKPPRILSVGIKTRQLSMAGAELALRFLFQNPNGVPLEIKDLDYSLTLEGQDFARGVIEDRRLPPHSQEAIEVLVKLDFRAGLGWALSLFTRKKASYVLEFKASYLIDGRLVQQKESMEGEIDFSPGP
jgi:LEA14-like dessication related protein